MNSPEPSAKRSSPWYTLLPCEQELATAVLQALWLANDGRGSFVRTPASTWGRLAHVGELAAVWARLLGVYPSPFCEIEYEEIDPT
jgi:hypothetical protein